MSDGTTFKLCGCRDEATGRPLGRQCPKLRRGNGLEPRARHLVLPDRAPAARRRHPPPPAAPRRLRHRHRRKAELDLARELLAIAAPGDLHTAIRIADAITAAMRETRTLPDPARVRKQVGAGDDPAVRPPTVGEWLEEWLTAKKKLRPGTVRSYSGHISLYLKPHLGHIPHRPAPGHRHLLDVRPHRGTQRRHRRGPRLRQPGSPRRRQGTPPGRPGHLPADPRHPPLGAQHLHEAAPRRAARQRRLPRRAAPGHPAQGAGVDRRARPGLAEGLRRPAGRRPRGGGRVSPVDIWISVPRPSPVMVWTPAQTIVFLEAARRHRLHALWRLIATRGLRRGEGCGLRRPDTDLGAALSTIRWQITQLGWDPVPGRPEVRRRRAHRRP